MKKPKKKDWGQQTGVYQIEPAIRGSSNKREAGRRGNKKRRKRQRQG